MLWILPILVSITSAKRCEFDTEVQKVIKPNDSVENGADFLSSSNVTAAKDCHQGCCDAARCDSSFHTDSLGTSGGNCFYFECKGKCIIKDANGENAGNFSIAHVTPESSPVEVLADLSDIIDNTINAEDNINGSSTVDELVPPGAECPEGESMVNCVADPCQFAVCLKYPDVICTRNYCGDCSGEFRHGNGSLVDTCEGSPNNVPDTDNEVPAETEDSAKSTQDTGDNFEDTQDNSTPENEKLGVDDGQNATVTASVEGTSSAGDETQADDSTDNTDELLKTGNSADDSVNVDKTGDIDKSPGSDKSVDADISVNSDKNTESAETGDEADVKEETEEQVELEDYDKKPDIPVSTKHNNPPSKVNTSVDDNDQSAETVKKPDNSTDEMPGNSTDLEVEINIVDSKKEDGYTVKDVVFWVAVVVGSALITFGVVMIILLYRKKRRRLYSSLTDDYLINGMYSI